MTATTAVDGGGAGGAGGQGDAVRVGQHVTLWATVRGSIPDGAAATVRVYDRGGGGERLVATLRGTVRGRRVQVPWVVQGHPGRRAHELALEFDVEAGGLRTARARILIRPERLVEVQLTTPHGSGDLRLRAGVHFHVLARGAGEPTPTFAEGQLFRAEIPRDYDGPLTIEQGGRAVVTLRLAHAGLAPTDPIRIRAGAHGAAAATAAAAGAPPLRLPPVAAQRPDATYVAPSARPSLAGGAAPGESVHVHQVAGTPPLPDGAHSVEGLSDRTYKWLMVQVFGSTLPPAVVDLVNNRAILREFGTDFYVKDQRYVVFRGNARLRAHLSGTRYRIDNPKVIMLTGGGRVNAARGLAEGVRGQGIAIVIVAALDVYEGIAQDKAWADILVDVASDTTKAVIGTAISVGILAAAAAFAPALVAAAPVGVVVLAGIGLGVVVGLGLDWLDNRFEITDSVRPAAHRAGDWLGDVWHDYVAEPWEGFMREGAGFAGKLEREILRQYRLPGGY